MTFFEFTSWLAFPEGILSRQNRLTCLSHSFAKAVTDMGFRQQVFGISGIVFDLHADLPDKRAQILKLISVFRPPYRPEQFCVGNRSTGIGHQIVEQLKLFGSQMDLASLLLNQMPIGIQMDIADHDCCNSRIRGPAPPHGGS